MSQAPSPIRSDVAAAVLAGAAVLVGLAVTSLPLPGLTLGMRLWSNEVIAFLGMSWWTLYLSGREPARFTTLTRPTVWPVCFGLAIGAAHFFAVVVPLQSLIESAAPGPMREAYDSARLLKNNSLFDQTLIIADVLLAAPLCEEFFFRGVLQRGLAGIGTPFTGLLLAALVFAVAHWDPLHFIALFELGLIFGVLAIRSRSLWPAIAAHAANNGISLWAFYGGDPDNAAELPSAETVIWVGALGGAVLLGLLLLARRFPRLLGVPLEEAVLLDAK